MEDSFENGDDSTENKVSSSSSVARTIETMETAQLCIHPIHRHSFSQVNFMISLVRKCAGCGVRLKPSLFGGGTDASHNTNNQVVRCLACGVYAHRSCAMASQSNNGSMWDDDSKKCPVNSSRLKGSSEEQGTDLNESEPELVSLDTKDERIKEETESKSQDDENDAPVETEESVKQEEKSESSKTSEAPHNALFQFLSSSSSFLTRAGDKQEGVETTTEVSSSVQNDDDDDDEGMVWTPEGPPRHWADKQSLSGILRPHPEQQETAGYDDDDEDATQPLHIANNKFASVSRALQENIIAHFIRRPFIEQSLSEDNAEAEESVLEQAGSVASEAASETSSPIRRTRTVDSETDSKVDMSALLTEVEPKSPEKPKSTIVRMASGTYEAAKITSDARKKVGLACVAGGIAGGVVGLVAAGPAGAVIGAKCGQTAGLVGAILEGSMTVGVFVAGVAAGSFTAHQMQLNQEKRILTIGEDGIKRKVLLVRPNIWIDPVWEKICADARESAPVSPRPIFGILPSSQAREADNAKRERYLRDSDIVQTDESEIPTTDKVLLLVSRSLNDKQSLPGHVYKSLIQEFRKRSEEREQSKTSVEDEAFENIDAESKESTTVADEQDDTEELMKSIRARRYDTHAVIKHVTATLLEVRPGFAASPTITEMSATSVEGLVFGELYDLVFEEIVAETKEVDEELVKKIEAFEKAHSVGVEEQGPIYPLKDRISPPALEALRMLPETHSAVDKLRFCVQFLELISVYFSAQGNQSALSADSLLKIVCQHIIAAKVPHINAEIAFLEEFARDEQLLRGKEGYALVTLQASLHFLNASTDFDRDIFEQEDDGEE